MFLLSVEFVFSSTPSVISEKRTRACETEGADGNARDVILLSEPFLLTPLNSMTSREKSSVKASKVLLRSV